MTEPAKKKQAAHLKLLDQLDPEEICRRLDVLEAEREALRILMRIARANQAMRIARAKQGSRQATP